MEEEQEEAHTDARSIQWRRRRRRRRFIAHRGSSGRCDKPPCLAQVLSLYDLLLRPLRDLRRPHVGTTKI
jgi:hypothetical protein